MAKKFTEEQIKQLIADDRIDIFYNSRGWRNLSRNIIIEQNRECQLCKARGKVAKAEIVHHVNKLKLRPDLAYSRYYIDARGKKQRQLIAVCFACHEVEHKRAFKGNTKPHKGYTNEEKF